MRKSASGVPAIMAKVAVLLCENSAVDHISVLVIMTKSKYRPVVYGKGRYKI